MKKIKKVLLLGSGPIVIGQACEFDYSGVQACKSLNEEGIKVILLNSNPASIMTDYNIAYKTFIEPMCLDNTIRIIKEEKPDGIVGGFGGQTSLNLLINLSKNKILSLFNVKVLGTNIKSIISSENRDIFKNTLIKNKLPVALSIKTNNIKDCLFFREQIVEKTNNENLIIRPSYTLGGLGGGISYCKSDFLKICRLGLKLSMNKEILIEESLIGWKEFELEILVDKYNYIVVCSIENIDPVGIHTGDSITISPILTLTDKEFQVLRNMSFKALKCLNIRNCGCNIQFALNSKNGDIKIIEINPRVSRSSALASKITGYPIAKITAKLLIGFSLEKLYNSITNNTIPAFFEPSIDYVAIKFPRFCNEKFNVKRFKLGTQMKSIGEIMSIGSTFEESLQKALRSNEDEKFYFHKVFEEKLNVICRIKIRYSYFYYIYDFLRLGIKSYVISKITNIEIWFIKKIKKILLCENEILIFRKRKIIKKIQIIKLKSFGFSDFIVSIFLKVSIFNIFNLRKILNIYPNYRKIDTCSGEFKSSTSYLYSTYNSKPSSLKSKFVKKNIVVIGSGPNKIGQGLEFDFCCTHASEEIKRLGYVSIMVNCNPETISTDYDISSKLYFEPIYFEDIYNIHYREKPIGFIIQFGGQTSLKLSNFLYSLGINILGTSSKATFLTENRKIFNEFLKKCSIVQPNSIILKNKENKIKNINFPVLVRPSFVLGGRMMRKIYNLKSLKKYILKIPRFVFPVLIDEFLKEATEFDIDCVSNGKEVFIPKIIHHVEKAGIHSGDSACFVPVLISKLNILNIKKIVKIIAIKLKIKGLMNVQMAIKDYKIYILEVNPRASRTTTFINKCCNFDIVSFSVFCILYNKNFVFDNLILNNINYFFVKESIFSFIKFLESDPALGPEMKSTGEVMSCGKNFSEAFLKSQISTDSKFFTKNFIIFVKNCNNLFFLKFFEKIFRNNIYIYKIKFNFNFLKNFSFFVKKKEISLVFIKETISLNKKEQLVLKKIRTLFKNNNIIIYTTNIAILCLLNSFKKQKFYRNYSLNEVYKDFI